MLTKATNLILPNYRANRSVKISSFVGVIIISGKENYYYY